MTGPSGLEIVQLPVGAYQANCYLVAREGGSGAVVIDPGDEPDAVQAELARRGWTASGVLVTHGHIDHIGGVAAVARAAGVDVVSMALRFHGFSVTISPPARPGRGRRPSVPRPSPSAG